MFMGVYFHVISKEGGGGNVYGYIFSCNQQGGGGIHIFIFLNLQTIRPNTDPSRQTKPPIRPNRRLILSNTAPSRQNKPPILQEFTMTLSTFTMTFSVEYGSKSTD